MAIDIKNINSSKVIDSISRYSKTSKLRVFTNETFVMCPPKYLSTKISNNVWMDKRKVDAARAMRQYTRIKRLISALNVNIIEIPPIEKAQDQTYTANVMVSIKPYIVLANYKAEGRTIEEKPARMFFENLGYKVIQPPTFFEGEADFKKWKDRIYFGGWGKFTDIKTLDWIGKQTGIEIVPIHEISDELYHLDCSLFIIDEQNFLVNKKGIDKESFKELEKRANITIVPPEVAITGITNAVKIPNKEKILLSGLFFPEEKLYQKAMDWMNQTFDAFGYTCLFMDIDEFDKSGADISCCIAHLDF